MRLSPDPIAPHTYGAPDWQEMASPVGRVGSGFRKAWNPAKRPRTPQSAVPLCRAGACTLPSTQTAPASAFTGLRGSVDGGASAQPSLTKRYT